MLFRCFYPSPFPLKPSRGVFPEPRTRNISQMVGDLGYYWILIGDRIRAINWYQFR